MKLGFRNLSLNIPPHRENSGLEDSVGPGGHFAVNSGDIVSFIEIYALSIESERGELTIAHEIRTQFKQSVSIQFQQPD